MATTGYINLEQLKTLYSKGEIDTVIMAFTDMQGRLIGKRVAARHFLDNIADHGAEWCNYLLAVDIENNTIRGKIYLQPTKAAEFVSLEFEAKNAANF